MEPILLQVYHRELQLILLRQKISLLMMVHISGNNLYLEWGAESRIQYKRIQDQNWQEPGADDVSSGYILLDPSGSTTIRNLEFEEGEIYYTTLEVINGANLYQRFVVMVSGLIILHHQYPVLLQRANM